MKKFSVLLCIVLSLVLLLCACNNTGDNSSSQSSSSQESSSSSQQPSSVAPQVIGVTYDSSNVRKTYVTGETFQNAGFAARAVLDNGKTNFLAANDYQFTTNFDSTTPGVYNVSVQYKEFETHQFSVTVVEKPVAEAGKAGKIDFIVDKAYNGVVGAKSSDNKYQYPSIKQVEEVLEGAAFEEAIIKSIYITAGTYEEKLSFTSKMKNVRLIGDKTGDTIISYGDYNTKMNGGTDSTATVTIKGQNFMASDIIFENSFDYINSEVAGKQALACLVEADMCVFNNCQFLGYQDTLQAKNGRQYYKDCVIKGNTDFIFGKSAVAVFENCEIVTRFTKEGETNNGYITAHSGKLERPNADGSHGMVYGYVFIGCRLTCEEGVLDGSVSLGRPWRCDATVAYINCEMGSHIATAPYGTAGVSKTRYASMEGGTDAQGNKLNNIPSGANFVEYGNTGAGAVAEASEDFTMLDATTAVDYTDFSKIFATTNGTLTFATEWDAVSALNAFVGE